MKKIVLLVANALFVMVLAGCSMLDVQRVTAVVSPAASDSSPLPAAVNDALTAQSADLSVAIDQGPYAGRILIAEPSYFAASGRTCRRVTVESDEQTQPFVACLQGDQWQLVRAIL